MASVATLVKPATSDNAGAITFPTFDQAPRGTVLQGTVSIPDAPIAAQFAAVVQGQKIGTFAGFNPWGPVQLSEGQTLRITGTGLTANTVYSAVWVVGQYPASAAPAPPIPYGSITQINNTQNNPVVVQVVQLPAPPATVNFSVVFTMTGSTVTPGSATLAVGVALIADPTNAAVVHIGASNVSTSSAYLSPGQGVVLPVQNANEVGLLGTSGDKLSMWGA